MIIPFCYFVTAGYRYDTLCLVIFVIAAFTDWFDGFYARRYKEFSDAGKLLDPLADKLLVTTAFVAFVQDAAIQLPVWTVVVILGREFLITGLRGLLAQYRVIVPASSLGKAKTVSQMCAIIIFLVSRSPDAKATLMVGYIIYYVAIVLTILSAIEYLWMHREQIIKSFSTKSSS